MSANRIFGVLWFTLGAVYVVAAVMASIGWSAGVRAGIDAGFRNGTATVIRLDPAGPAWAAGVREGDRLLTVDGRVPTEDAWSRTGDIAASMEFVGPTGRQTTVFTHQEGVPGAVGFVSLEVTAGIFALVGLFVFARPHRSAPVVAVSVFAIVAAVAIAAAPGAGVGDPSSRTVEATALHWLPVAFVALALSLGQDPRLSRRPSLPLWTAVMPLTALALDVSVALRMTVAPGLHSVVSSAAYSFLAGGLLLGPAVLLRRYLTSESPVFKEQIRVIAIGTVFGVLPVVILSAIPQGAGIGFIVDPSVTVIGTVLIPLALAYAILRHELMGIRRLVHRGVSYAMISVLVLTLYVAAIVTIRAMGGGDVGAGSPLTLTLLVVLLAGVPLVPRVREMASRTVNRLLYRDFVDHREVVRRVSLQAVETATVPSLMSSMLSTVSDALGLACAAYVEREDGHTHSVAHVGEADEEFIESPGTRAALQDGNPVSLSRMDARGTREGECLFAPISGGSSNSGVLALGPKATGEPFSKDDLQMIQTIAGLVSTAVARLRLLDELKDKNIELVDLNARLMEVEEQERARLSAYLHDEPLQKVTYVLSQHRERELDQDLASILGDVAREIRTISTSLSPALLTDLGLIPALEWLVSEMKERADFRIDFQHSGLGREQRLPSAVELVAYRVAQEALTNCQKHSSAAAVWVSLKLDDGVLRVSVEDNGEGLAQPDWEHRRLPEHLGLVGMRQRVESQNGRLVVENRKSRGVRVAAYLPLGGAPARAADIDPDRR